MAENIEPKIRHCANSRLPSVISKKVTIMGYEHRAYAKSGSPRNERFVGWEERRPG